MSKFPVYFAVRLTDAQKSMLDTLARAEPDRPSDGEVVRRLIERAHGELQRKTTKNK